MTHLNSRLSFLRILYIISKRIYILIEYYIFYRLIRAIIISHSTGRPILLGYIDTDIIIFIMIIDIIINFLYLINL